MALRLDFSRLAPGGERALGGVYVYLRHSGVDKQLLDLVFLRASQINGCAYCIDMHSRDLLQSGVSQEKITLLPVWHEVDGIFDASERAALQWTEAVTSVAQSRVPDEAFTQLKSQFDDKAIADLTLAIGTINVYNRLAISFRRPPGVALAAA